MLKFKTMLYYCIPVRCHLILNIRVFSWVSIVIFTCSFWGMKYLLVIGGIIGAFFIPQGTFGTTWMYFGMIGGFLYIIIQLILIVDFAHTWAEKWVGNYEETESKIWYVALLVTTFLCYALTITGVTLLFVFFTTVRVSNSICFQLSLTRV